MNVFFAAVITVLAITTHAGCATLFKSKTTKVPITALPPGTQVAVDGVPLGTTPTRLVLKNNKEHVISFRTKDGRTGTCKVTSSVSGGWAVLDLLTVGVGLVVDWATSNWNNLETASCRRLFRTGGTQATVKR